MIATMSDDPPSGVAPRSSAAEPASDNERSPFETLEPQASFRDAVGENAVQASGTTTEAGRLDLVLDIPVRLSVELGRTEIPIREVVNLGRGSMIELDRSPGAPLDVRVNGVLIGRGEVVVINEERLGLRFVEVASQAERVKRLG
jgi:flagellar motor switch protein FliN